jgi:hypothetical protein
LSNDPSDRVRRRLNELHADATARLRVDGNAVLNDRAKAWLLEAIEADLLSDEYRLDDVETAAGGQGDAAFDEQPNDVSAVLARAIAAELISGDQTRADTGSISSDGTDKSDGDALLDLADGIRQAFLADAQRRRQRQRQR